MVAGRVLPVWGMALRRLVSMSAVFELPVLGRAPSAFGSMVVERKTRVLRGTLSGLALSVGVDAVVATLSFPLMVKVLKVFAFSFLVPG